MALNISSSQIYAGRYHYKRQEIPNLLDTQKYTASTPGKSVKEATGVDTVTISDEGLAKAKDWREYTKDNENISHTGVNPKEELYKELNTVNNMTRQVCSTVNSGKLQTRSRKKMDLVIIRGRRRNFLPSWRKPIRSFMTVLMKNFPIRTGTRPGSDRRTEHLWRKQNRIVSTL